MGEEVPELTRKNRDDLRCRVEATVPRYRPGMSQTEVPMTCNIPISRTLVFVPDRLA